MPAIKVTPAKGLHQVTGTSAIGSGTLSGHLQVVETIVGAGQTRALTQADSGKLFLITSADGTLTFTLPPLLAGFNCEIIFSVLSDNDVAITAPGDNMIVSAAKFTASGAAGSHVTDTVTTLTINADTVAAVVGTRVRIYCDGTNYVAIAESSTQDNTAMFVGS